MASNHRKRKRQRVRGGESRYTVRGVRRGQVDVGKFSKALLGLAMAEAERQAQAEHTRKTDEPEVTAPGQPQAEGDDHVTTS